MLPLPMKATCTCSISTVPLLTLSCAEAVRPSAAAGSISAPACTNLRLPIEPIISSPVIARIVEHKSAGMSPLLHSSPIVYFPQNLSFQVIAIARLTFASMAADSGVLL